jgi:branched-chain amino acid transport system substrate-binding protein
LSKLNRRQALKLLAALGAGGAAAPILSACSNGNEPVAPNDLSPVKIGLVVPQSGLFKTIGDELTNGFQLYLSMNDNRLGGRPVRLVTVDEGETADSGKAAVDRLIKQERVLALSGVASSATMGAIKELVESSQIPLIGSNASPNKALPGVRYIWRTSCADDESGQALGKYMAGKVGGGSVAVLAADYQAGREAVDGFRDKYGSVNIDPIYTAFGSSGPGVNFQPALNTVRTSGAKAVAAFYSGAQAVEFVKQYRQSGLSQPLYAAGSLTEGVLLSQEGDAARGIYTSSNYSPDLDNEANQKFTAAYQKTFDSIPTTYAMASYDAGFVLDKAIGLAGSGDPSPQLVNLALGKIGSIDSPRGSWQFNHSRTPLQTWWLRQVRQDGGVLSNTVLSELSTLG